MSFEPDQIPTVTDKRTTPPGILPQNIHRLLLSGLAILMVLVILFSARSNSKPKPSSEPNTSTPMPPSSDRLNEYKQQIDAETQRLKAEQAELEKTKKSWSATSGQLSPPAVTEDPGTNSYASRSVSYPSEDGSPENSLHEDMEKRRYMSRFSSNIALSYREQPNAANPGSSTIPAAAVPPMDPRVYASLVSATQMSQLPPMTDANSGGGSKHSDHTENGAAKLPPAELRQSHGKDYRLFEGTILETTLTNRLDGTFSGPVNCIVSYDVYSQDHRHVLIPSGSRVLGDVHPVQSYDQQRLAVTFHRLIMPDGYSVNLDTFQGLDQIGETGLRDKVNHHYLQIFGTSIAIGMIAGLAQSNTEYGYSTSATDAYRQGVANSLGQSSMHILDRFLNMLPTVTIREGQRIKIYLSEDLLLPAYENHDMPDNI
jgi:type IV secretion system protein TrbI